MPDLTIGYLLPTREEVMRGREDPEPLLGLAVEAERAGFDAVWVGDSPLARPRHDALLMLAAVAARTSRVTLGTAVLLAPARNAVALAHSAATLDRLAAGRLVLGLGAGFPYPATERQFEALGMPFRGRIGRLEETIAAMRALWSAGGEPVTVHGRHVAFEDVAVVPGPHRPGGPPLWLAGIGERAEERVGRLADGWLPYPPEPARYAEAWARVSDAARRAERPEPVAGMYLTAALDADPAVAQERLRTTIEAYYEMPVDLVGQVQALYAGTPEGLAERVAQYAEAGARHVVLRICDERPERGLREATRVRELVA